MRRGKLDSGAAVLPDDDCVDGAWRGTRVALPILHWRGGVAEVQVESERERCSDVDGWRYGW